MGCSPWGHVESDRAERLSMRIRMSTLCCFSFPFGLPGGSAGKASARNAGNPGSIPGSRRSPGEGNGDPLRYSCLDNPTDGGAWWATVHGVVKSRTRLSDFTFTFHFHALEKEMATHSSVLAWRIPGSGEPDGPFYGVAQSQTRLKRLSSSSSRHWRPSAALCIIKGLATNFQEA